MLCEEFDPEKFAQLLMIKAASGRGSGPRNAYRDPEVVRFYEATAKTLENGREELRQQKAIDDLDLAELFLHYESCPPDERKFQEYLAKSQLTVRELELIHKGMINLGRDGQ